MKNSEMTEAQRLKRNEYARAYRLKYYAAKPEKREAQNRATAAWHKRNPDKSAAKAKRYQQKVKAQVMLAYGGSCACCGENEVEFLTIDHVKPLNNRKRPSSYQLYMRLVKEGFPAGYQVLCFNCNLAKRSNPECPHRLIFERHFVLLQGSRRLNAIGPR